MQRITAELGRTSHVDASAGPSQQRVRLVDHQPASPYLLVTLTLADAAALRDQLSEVLAEAERVRRAEVPGGHDPGG